MTTFPRLIDNFATNTRSDHAAGAGTFALTVGAGAVVLARLAALGVGSVSPADPFRFSVLPAAAVNAYGLITDPTKVSVYRATSLTGDTLGGLTLEAGSADQAFPSGSVVQVYWTAEDVALLQAAVSALEAATVPATGLVVTQHYAAVGAPADGPTVTLDLAAFDAFAPAPLGGDRTLALANARATAPWSKFTLVLTQGSGGQAVTWFDGISWPGGAEPTLSAGSGERDVFEFLQLGPADFLGSVVGQNY